MREQINHFLYFSTELISENSRDVEALRGISLTFEERLCYEVIGKSGSGKSTRLHVLGCLDKPDEGRVAWF